MSVRNEKLRKLISGFGAGLGCMAMAGLLFLAAPIEVRAVPLGSQPSGTSTPAGEDGGSNEEGEAEAPENEEGGSEASVGGTVTSATVTANNVNVRSDASTSASVAGKVSSGTELTVTGEKADSSGMTWYAVTDGGSLTGYIRSDMVEAHITEAVPAEPEQTPEDQPAEEPEEPVVTNDYFVQYEDDGTGTGTNAWYLYDNTMGNKYSVSQLLSAQETNQNNEKLMEEQTGKLKMIIVAMAAVILILIVVLTVFILKLRNSYDDDDYDDEDDEDEDDEDDEEEEEEPRKRRFGFGGRRSRDEDDEDDDDEDDDEEEEEERRSRRKAPVSKPVSQKPSRRSKYDEDEDDEEDEEEEYRPRRSAKASKGQSDKSWQSKNFLDDDDLEFEFLDLK